MSNTNADRPLKPGYVVTDEDLANRSEDDRLGPADEDEDEPGLQTNADRENQATTEWEDPDKFQRE